MAEDFAIGKALLISDDTLNRLELANIKIKKIESNSEKMAERFKTAMTTMNSGAGTLLEKLQSIQSLVGSIGSLNANGLNSISSSMSKTAVEAEKVANGVAKVTTAINKMGSSSYDDSSRKAYIEKYKMYERMFDQIERNEKRAIQATEREAKAVEQAKKREYEAQAQLDSKLRKQNYQSYVTSTEGALRTADTADSYTRRAIAIKNLEAAIKRLRTTDANYQNDLKRLSDAHKRLSEEQKKVEANFKTIRQSQSNLMNTSDQLARKLALVFSISQIEGYINRLIKVRGEFELQNTALASILQNKDKADKLFGQITELAVKSPYTIRELTTYTKSLSAYSVEYEKLYDTTKMLADVSAGLGVDMQRLILAFGQVKAANFLRGTETRQFTEAGINMLGELAKYYSELEGRIVSVTEVQDRQFKRMISFQDVEEVFKRLTSAGGMFYNMQEKQADTLAGMVSNMEDSIDIMLNDIGKANEGTIKNIISFIKDLVENWKTIAQVAEPIASVLVLYLSLTKSWSLATKYLPKLYNNIASAVELVKYAIVGANTAQKGFNKAVTANGVLAVLSLVAIAFWEIYNAIKASKEEQEELNKIASEGAFSSQKSSAQYERLANVVSDVTASYQEQEEALKQLQREYGEILPKHYLEAEAIRAMKGNYDEATAAIQNYIRAKTQEKQLQYISEEYGEKVQEAQGSLAKKIKDELERTYDVKISQSELNTIFQKFEKDIESGFVKSANLAVISMQSAYSEYFGNTNYIDLDKFIGPINDYYKAVVEMKEKTDSIINETNVNFGDKITYELQKQREALDKQIAEVNKYLNVISKQGEVGKEGSLVTQSQIDDAKAKVIEYAKVWDYPIEKIQNLKGGVYEISQITKDIKVSALNSFVKQIGSMKLPTAQLASARMFMQEVQKEANAMDNTPFQNYIEGIVVSSAKLNNVSLDGLMDAFARADESTGDYAKRLKGKIEALEYSLEHFRKSPFLVPEWNLDEGKADLAEKQIAVLKSAYEAVTVETDKERKKRESAENKAQKSALDLLKERIDLIKKAGEEYKKLRQYYDEEEATKMVKESFADAFGNISLSLDMNFDTSGVINAIESLQTKAIKGGKKAVDEALSQLRTENKLNIKAEGLEEIQKQVEDIFSDYEFSLDLKTAGIDPNAFKNMLKAVGASDEELSLMGLDTTTFEQAQQKIRDIIKDLQEQGGKDQLDLAKKYQQQLTELEIKEARKRFDELLKLREKYQTNEEKIAKVQTDVDIWQKQLDDINKSKEARDALYAQLKDVPDFMQEGILSQIEDLNKVISDENEELLKLQIQNGEDTIRQLQSEALQLTDFWRQLFGDLGDLSVNTLRSLSSMVDDIVGSATEIKGNKGQTVGYSAKYTDKSGIEKQVTLTVEQYQRLLKQNNNIADEIQEKNPFIALWDAVTKGKNEGETQLDYITRLDGMLKDVSDAAFDVANNLADIFGANEEAKEFISNMQGVVNGAIDIGSGIAKITAGDYIGGSIQAISGIASAITSIFNMGDKKKEKEIQKQLELVDRLEKAYDRLYDTIENGLSIDAYSMNSQLVDNLRDRIEALQSSIESERDKKNSDSSRIEEWQDEIAELEGQISELYDNLKSDLVGDFKSVASELGDAIAEAFANGTDAAEAWGESVNNIVADIVKNILVQKLIEPGVQQILDQIFESAMPKTSAAADIQKEIDSLLDEYTSIVGSDSASKKRRKELEEQIKKLQEEQEKASQEAEGEIPNITQDIIDSALGALTDLGDDVLNNPAWGMLEDLLQNQGDTMSGLSKSISGITETQADALAAITESIRYFASDSNMVLHNIYNWLINPPAESPLMHELRIQSNYLSGISSLLNSVSKNVTSNGRVLKVQIV